MQKAKNVGTQLFTIALRFWEGETLLKPFQHFSNKINMVEI